MNKKRRSSLIENSIYFNRLSSLKNERKSNVDTSSFNKLTEDDDKTNNIFNFNHFENMEEKNNDDDKNISSENISVKSN